MSPFQGACHREEEHLDDQTPQIFDSARADNASGTPGEIVALDDAGFTVAAGSGGIAVKRVRLEGAGKVPAAEFAGTAGLALGSKLG